MRLLPGEQGARVWSLALLLLAVLASGCLWRGYDKIMSVHPDVLTHAATKLALVAESGGGLGGTAMEEYVYPAQRARQFLQQFDSNRDRSSYQQLAQLLDRYEAFVKRVDASRAAPDHGGLSSEWLNGERDAIWEQAAKIRVAVEDGH